MVNHIDIYTTIFFVVSVFILFITALISGAENAYFSLKSEQIKELEKRKNFRNNLIIKHLENPKTFLATLTVSHTFLYVCFIVFMGIVLTRTIDVSAAPSWGFIMEISIIAFLLLLFAHLIPRYYARKNPLKFVKLVALIVLIFEKLFYPIIALMSNTSTLIERKLAHIKQNITIDDLSQALNLTTHQITEDENILKGIVKFGNIDAKEILTSRVDVYAVELNTSFKDLLAFIIESGHSRIPVYADTFDNIKGILFIKDLLPYINKEENFNWQSLIRPPYFVPENKKINDLLKEFQENKIHMAIVIDEYGGTSGIVTLEDVLEEIVGEITDESDEEEIIYSQLSDNTYLFEGKTLINDFIKIINIDDDFFDDIQGDADTIAGIILELTGEIPSKNKKIEYKNICFTIESVDKRRIKQIKVVINE